MYEFEIYNEKTNEFDVIFGYNEADAWRRTTRFNKDEWSIVGATYID